MNKRSKIIVSVVGIFIVLLALVGITYAYFLTQVQGNTNDTSISITTANLRLVYRDGTPNIEAQNIQPGDTVYTKTFTVTNEGNASIDYEVYLENVINNFVHEEDLLMFITCSSNKGTACNNYGDGSVSGEDIIFGESVYPYINSKLIENTIAPSSMGTEAEVHTYTLYLKFKDDGTDQSNDMGKDLKGKIQIYDPDDTFSIVGAVKNFSDGDYLEFTNEEKIIEISKLETYSITGLKPGQYTLFLKNKDSDGNITIKSQKIINIIKGDLQYVSSDLSDITVTTNTVHIMADINLMDGIISMELVSDIGKEILRVEKIQANVELKKMRLLTLVRVNVPGIEIFEVGCLVLPKNILEQRGESELSFDSLNPVEGLSSGYVAAKIVGDGYNEHSLHFKQYNYSLSDIQDFDRVYAYRPYIIYSFNGEEHTYLAAHVESSLNQCIEAGNNYNASN